MGAPIASESISAASLTTQELYREILVRMGEDPNRDGLADTPERVAKSMAFLTRGYSMDVNAVIHEALFDVDYDEMVVVKDVEFFSLCEHHLLPFFGKAHIAYLPNGKVIGLSKIPRVVDVFARRLQVQERLTTQIADAIADAVAWRSSIPPPSPRPCAASSRPNSRPATNSSRSSAATATASEDRHKVVSLRARLQPCRRQQQECPGFSP
jgi:GTP cyclohydrolase I